MDGHRTSDGDIIALKLGSRGVGVIKASTFHGLLAMKASNNSSNTKEPAPGPALSHWIF